MQQPPIIERALDIARSGRAKTIADVRQQLKREGYAEVLENTAGWSIREQLKTLMREALSLQQGREEADAR